MGLSFGLLSFAGFEQVATLGEEVTKSRFTIPRVLIGTVLGAGLVFTVVTAAQTLGFGTDPAGVTAFTKSTSLLADLSARYFGGWSGDLFDAPFVEALRAARQDHPYGATLYRVPLAGRASRAGHARDDGVAFV
jgi:amino acid transporter